MSNSKDIEIYIKGFEIGQLIDLLTQEIGTLSLDSEIDEGLFVYTVNDAKILINTGIQDGFTSINLKVTNNWQSDVEFARYIAGKTDLIVRCDPGSEYPNVSPYSDTFVEISQQGEHLVEWG